MAVDPVPFVIGAGAVHSDEVWRVFANAATRDSEGVALPGNCKVTALGTPGEAVNVAAGGLIIRNAQAPGQSYVARVIDSTQINIPRNNSGSVVRHLLIGRIIDPDFAPWQPSGTPGAPNVSVPDGPYFELFLVSGVGAGVTRASQVVTYSALALARIDVPSTGSGPSPVTTANIVDCRELAQPRVGFAFDIQQVVSQQTLALNTGGWIDWPSNSLSMFIPRWATHAQATIRINSILGFPSGSDALFRVNLAGATGISADWDFNAPSGLVSTDAIAQPLSMYGEFDVRALQGTTVVVKPQANRNNVAGPHGGVMRVDATQHQVEFDIRFSERVV